MQKPIRKTVRTVDTAWKGCPLLKAQMTKDGYSHVVTLASGTPGKNENMAMLWQHRNGGFTFVSGSRSLFERYKREVK